MVYRNQHLLVFQCHITHGSDMRHDLGTLLHEDDLETVLSSQHPPFCIIQFMSECLERVHLADSKQNILVSKILHLNSGFIYCMLYSL
jgi:predicted membrane chloride channel (bestrophin family)